MATIKIVTDTNSHLNRPLREKYDIDYMKMCNIMNGESIPADTDWEGRWTCHEFYELLKKTVITTTQVPIEEFRKYFTACLEAGQDVIYVGCSLPLSSSVNTGTVVARELLEKYPDRKIVCIDSKNCCLGEGQVAVYAAELRNAGKSVEEIVAAVEDMRKHVNQYVTVGSLDMLKRAGRIKGAKAFFGNLFGVKPILMSDSNGQNVAITKAKGRKASLDKLIELIKESVINPEEQTVYIDHADCPEDAEYLKEKAMELGFKDAAISTMCSVVGACIGGGAIGISCIGKEVTLVG